LNRVCQAGSTRVNTDLTVPSKKKKNMDLTVDLLGMHAACALLGLLCLLESNWYPSNLIFRVKFQRVVSY
jgi:hypothetical protein